MGYEQIVTKSDVFTGSGSNASAGLVPSPSTTAGTTKYLREDGTWEVPPVNDTYTHPTTSGNKHIPAGGSEGKILKWASDGTASWEDVPGGSAFVEVTQAEYDALVNSNTDDPDAYYVITDSAGTDSVLNSLIAKVNTFPTIHISTSKPTSSDGSEGDIWIMYELGDDD